MSNSRYFMSKSLIHNKINRSSRLCYPECKDQRATRLELAIFSLGRRHSTTELCPHRTSLIYHKILFFSLIFYKFPLLQVNSSTIFLNIYVKILQNFFSFSFFYLFWKLPQEYQFKCLLYSSLWWWKNKKMSR